MGTYQRFEDLPVWKAAVELAVSANHFVRTSPLAHDRDYTSQLRRAALSTSNNIAEGFERGTTEELLSFIYIARGSAGEVRSMMYVLERLAGYDTADLRSQISNLKSSAESIGRQLRGWADTLQSSDIKGQRRLTDKTRKWYRARKEAEEYDRELRTWHGEHLRKLREEQLVQIEAREQERHVDASTTCAASTTNDSNHNLGTNPNLKSGT
ncbi:four helix bundle protein [Candidatus Uhrbacteria bacterium]|nr:four helix bundle protein [Candidatus Uhrbacteria bacterium]